MQNSPTYNDPMMMSSHHEYNPESYQSGVMWGAIISGALTITVISLALFSLAAALGFASMSPWENTPSTGKAFAISGAIALIVIQWISAGLGGYLTGRLRSRYIGAHTHEVFFRDTVHGFLSWSLATILGAILLMSAAMHMHGSNEGGMRHIGMGSMRAEHSPMAHYTDRLFRPALATTQSESALSEQDRMSADHILEAEAINGNVPEEDKSYLAQLVSARTGLSNADAEQRVENVLAQEKADVKDASKYAAASSLFLFFSMIIGAFIASAAGGLGGQHRDTHYTTGELAA